LHLARRFVGVSSAEDILGQPWEELPEHQELCLMEIGVGLMAGVTIDSSLWSDISIF